MRYFILLCVTLSLSACAQKKNQKQKPKMYNIENYLEEGSKNITVDNFVTKIIENKKSYDSEPLYYLRINKQMCLIEVFVNGVLILQDNELSNYVTPHEINYSIFKSGEQTVTIKMYPVENLINESFGREGTPITELQDNSSVAIKVVKIDNRSNKGFEDEALVTTHQSPTNSNGAFIATGKPYYEYSFTFNAKVPYEFEGSAKGQDLRKLNQDLVTKKALEFYKMSQQIIVNKDLESWLKLNYFFNKRTQAASYSTEKDFNELLEEYKEELSRNYTAIPIKEYKLEFRGEGKLVVLKHTSTDPFYKRELALVLKYTDEDGDLSSYFPGVVLYLPEGRSLEEGLMMWK
ncbi:hypothetical protein [Tenacibaculum finnmarkense]|uniref:hypothetical protein n=1 Tax=Tenacibaculum finnmarkense TaxID=2781243 RepID=UPI001EFB0D77|nr:hypothetical protein [Tenacibaculum finnmarkense]MCG8734660.1 hypothetical protein [Tenacibaculum finnmarkense]MCG8860054.1 hypothetical protein [Tenacibaculum finnmarkense]